MKITRILYRTHLYVSCPTESFVHQGREKKKKAALLRQDSMSENWGTIITQWSSVTINGHQIVCPASRTTSTSLPGFRFTSLPCWTKTQLAYYKVCQSDRKKSLKEKLRCWTGRWRNVFCPSIRCTADRTSMDCRKRQRALTPCG